MNKGRLRLRYMAGVRTKSDPGRIAGDVTFLPMEAVGDRGEFDRDSVRPADEIGAGYSYFEEGDVLRARVTPCFENGKGAVLRGLVGGRGFGSTELVALQPGPGTDPRFLYYVVTSHEFTNGGAGALYGAHGVKRVPEKFFRDFVAWAPDEAVQRAVADYLDRETARIDALIEKKRRLIERQAERDKALIFALVTRGLDSSVAHIISGIPWIPSPPAHWVTMNLGAVAHLHRGYDLPTDDRMPGDVPVVTSGGFETTHSKAMVKGPGVVTGRYGTVGRVLWVDQDFWPLNTTLYVDDYRANHPRFIYYMLQTLPLEADSFKSAVPGVNRNVLHRLRVARPPESEQVQIAVQLDALLGRRAPVRDQIERQIALLQERRQAVITAAITGKTDVADAA
jgi:type I restriction enzyme S subunit